ncbi:MAG: prolyl oligopeptidase family serine peptidase [Wenzhouxiangellaceae bacterium]
MRCSRSARHASRWLLVAILWSVAACNHSSQSERGQIEAPEARRIAHWSETPAGERYDPYAWLRDDTRTSPGVLAHLRAETAYLRQWLEPLRPLHDELFDEIAARLPEQRDSAFHVVGGYTYWSRERRDAAYPVLMRRPLDGTQATEQIVLDPNRVGEDGGPARIGGLDLSPDGRWLAWLQDVPGRRQFALFIRDLGGDRTIATGLAGLVSVSWSPDASVLYTVQADPLTLRPRRLLALRVSGAITAGAEVLWDESDAAFHAVVGRTRSNRYNYLFLKSASATELHVIETGRGRSKLELFCPRAPGHLYYADHAGAAWIIRSNRQAPNFRMLRVSDPDRADPRAWQEIVPHDPDVLIEAFDPFDSFLALDERTHGRRRVRILDYRNERFNIVDPGDTPGLFQLGRNPDPSRRVVQVAWTALNAPRSTWEIDLDTGRWQLIDRLTPKGGFAGEDYIAWQEWVTARDGARVPVSLVRHRDTALDGSAPLLLNAYGAYGITLDPAFAPERLSLLDRGFVVGIAHVRGSRALGEHWYVQGRGLAKWNTFNDFVDVTRALARSGRVDPRRIFARGESAGGLVMGVVANEAPELYAGIIAEVPFVDVLTTMLDTELPLTTLEYREWGDPRDPLQYRYMRSWSPYDNVRATAYPAMLVRAALWDSQVPYWGPVKWVARLRHAGTGVRPVLLDVDLEGGHQRAAGRIGLLERTAWEYAFLLDQAGMSRRD